MARDYGWPLSVCIEISLHLRNRGLVLDLLASNLKGYLDSYAPLSTWNIDGFYGTAADCDAAYHDDLNSLVGLEQNSHDFLQTILPLPIKKAQSNQALFTISRRREPLGSELLCWIHDSSKCVELCGNLFQSRLVGNRIALISRLRLMPNYIHRG